MVIFKKIFANLEKFIKERLTDIDGNVYRTVKIGKQLWMAENLKVTHYRNGDEIPNVTDESTWKELSTGARCAYARWIFGNEESAAAVYGYLYNWYAVNDPRNIAPPGWHVPTDEEWQTLLDYLGGYYVAGGKMKEAGTKHWVSPEKDATNKSGFSALPGGYREYYGEFLSIGSEAHFWSSSEYYSDRARYVELRIFVDRYQGLKQLGLSVRLVRD